MRTVERSIAPNDELSVILGALNALKRGDPAVRLPLEWTGVAGRVADVFNDVAERNGHMARELARLGRVVGKEGKLGTRGTLGEVTGFWRDSIDSVNVLIDDLVHPTSETARVIGAVAQGDLSQTMALEVEGQPLRGEFLRTARTVNRMVDQLGSFAAEVTRVAREVGTEGKLGGQAKVKGVAGTWKDLTDSVNSMAGNLTAQVRNIADVTTAVATGDLSKKIAVDVKGEILELKNTINTMVDQLRSFASEVTRVAREVGTEGRLGGPGRRPGRRRDVEGPDRERELDGEQPDGSGAQHRGRDEGGGERRPVEEDHRRRQGRDPGAQEHDQHDGGPARLVRVRSDARRPRGRHGRAPRRAGRRAGRRGNLEGPDRERQLDGQQPDGAGAQHRGRDDGGRDRRPVEEDHRGRQGRDPRAQEHHQHDGRPAAVVRRRSDARRARSRNGGQAGRPGRRAGRGGDVEGPDRQRQHHGQQSDRTGAQHRGRDQGRGERRPVQEDHGGRQGRDPRAQEHDQHDGGSAELVRVGSHARRTRGRHGGHPRWPGEGQGRRRNVEGPDRQRELHGGQPHEPGARDRQGGDRGRQRRPAAEADRRGEG